jgi:hypothetical protein
MAKTVGDFLYERLHVWDVQRVFGGRAAVRHGPRPG